MEKAKERWEREHIEAKCARNKGETYNPVYNKVRSDALVPAHTIGPPCKYWCFDKLGPDNVKDIFNNFWEIGNFDLQNA